AYDAIYANPDFYAFEFEPLKEPIPTHVMPTLFVNEPLTKETAALIQTNQPDHTTLGQLPDSSSFRFPSSLDYHKAYSAGTTTPDKVARKVLDLIAESEKATPPLRAFVEVKEHVTMAMARESTERYRAGKPLSVIDGVPVSLKDTMFASGFTWSYGISDRQPGQDMDFVTRLKSLGAVIVGISLSTETANTDFGPNPAYGTPRNPYKAGHITGGSSAGAAAAVASGL
ncbi:hypothetical protein HDU93_005907, partial [Gonapodya sp. JEL0774]